MKTAFSKILISLAAIALLLLSQGCGQLKWPPVLATPAAWASSATPSATEAPAAEGFPVLAVTDGDTIKVDIDGKEVSVRLIGIDAPESVHPDAARNTEEGRIASAYVEGLLHGRRVTLEYDVSEEDMYGRRLAYVYLDTGEMLNELLLEEGYASVMTVPPDVKYAERFTAAQQKAREAGAGFWKETKE